MVINFHLLKASIADFRISSNGNLTFLQIDACKVNNTMLRLHMLTK
nr:MAG TPA: hypothetical protein [Caudoviricetes sp.]